MQPIFRNQLLVVQDVRMTVNDFFEFHQLSWALFSHLVKRHIIYLVLVAITLWENTDGD